MSDPYGENVGDPQLLAEIRDELARTRSEVYRLRNSVNWILLIAAAMALLVSLWLLGAVTVEFEPVGRF